MNRPIHTPSRVQRLPVAGYKRATHARHLLLAIRSAEAARALLQQLHHDDRQGLRFGPADGWHAPEASGLDIGFSHDGLLRLGLPAPHTGTLATRARAFKLGAYQRAARLGDSGDSAPLRWERGFAPRETDLMLSMHAADAATIDTRWRHLTGLRGWADAFELRSEQPAAHLPQSARNPGRRSEHFGFADGLANPDLGLARPRALAPDTPTDAATPTALGELLLGHPNQVGANPWVFDDDAGLPQPPQRGRAPDEFEQKQAELSDFFRDGCFGVLRKMAQHVEVFEAWVDQAARRLMHAAGPLDLDAARLYIKAKLCGRWPNGQVLSERDGYRQPDADAEGLNRFDFSDDPQGRACPFGSHIRRMNPRSDAVVPARTRALVRRGMPYEQAGDADRQRERERGLMGLFFCASIEDQFEHLLGEWANKNPMGPDNAGTAKDPLIGQHEDPEAFLEIWLPDGRPLRLDGLPPFVQTRGTLYLFYPSERAYLEICGARP